MHAPQRSQQHCLQQASHGNSLSVHWRTSGWRGCGARTHGVSLAHRRGWTTAVAATGMQLETIKCSQAGRERQHAASLTCGISNRMQMSKPAKQEQTHKQKQSWLPRRRGGEDREFGVSRGKLLQTGRISSRALLCRAGSSVQHPVISHHGTEYVAEPPDCAAEIHRTL